MSNIGTVTVTITLWDEGKTDALISKLSRDARVMSVQRIDQGPHRAALDYHNPERL